MNNAEFTWEERQGRYPDDSPFHEWTYQHGSGRLLAAIQGPQDSRGGFAHSVSFLFSQEVTMRGGPFVFVDFDSAKRFVEATVEETVMQATTEGALTVPELPNPVMAGMKEAMENFGNTFMKKATGV